MLEKDFKNLILQAKQDILATRYNVMQHANSELIMLYFRLGKIVSENASYGNKFIQNFSTSLRLEFPNTDGFSERNLSRMKKFYEEYKDLSILPTALAKLPWSHNMLLLDKVKDLEIRKWYAEKCFENGWSHTVLEHQIDSGVYERQVLAEKLTNFNEKLPLPQSELARNIMKDPYIFELEGIKDDYIEKDIENAMLEKIKNVLLELGKGFMFVGTQQRVTLGNTHYYVDMVFYNKILKCYVLIDLKIGTMKPEYAGQMNMYLNYYNAEVNDEYDNKPIGIILCKSKKEVAMEYALGGLSNNIFASTYTYYIPNKEQLISEVEKVLNETEAKD